MKIKIDDLRTVGGETIADIVNNPEHPISKGVMNSFATKEGDTITCKQCGEDYIRGIWNFHNLCNPCFAEFDKKKMEERFKQLYL